MNDKVNQLIDKVRMYTPLDGRILVHALKLKTMKQEDYSFEVADTKANKGKDPEKHRVDLQKVQPKVNCKYQEAIVLQCDPAEERFSVGDTIIYPVGCMNPFDLVKGVSVMKKWDVVAVKRIATTDLEQPFKLSELEIGNKVKVHFGNQFIGE